jgi:hypothetical protein
MRYVRAGAAPRRPAVVYVSPAEQRRVVFASSLGTIFEWYDFYLYATLAPFFASLFFPPGNDTGSQPRDNGRNSGQTDLTEPEKHH